MVTVADLFLSEAFTLQFVVLRYVSNTNSAFNTAFDVPLCMPNAVKPIFPLLRTAQLNAFPGDDCRLSPDLTPIMTEHREASLLRFCMTQTSVRLQDGRPGNLGSIPDRDRVFWLLNSIQTNSGVLLAAYPLL